MAAAAADMSVASPSPSPSPADNPNAAATAAAPHNRPAEAPAAGSSSHAEASAASPSPLSATPQEEQQQQQEEQGECGFCVFMKAGPCGDTFARWEQCVEQVEKEERGDVVAKCWSVTELLKTCMEANAEYYGIVLQAEQAIMVEEVDHKNEQTVAEVETDNNSLNNDEGAVPEGTGTEQSE